MIDLLKGMKFILLYFIWRVGVDFYKKTQILENKKFSFYFSTFNFLLLLLLHQP